MPAKSTWYRKLPYIINALRAHPFPYVDRAAIELHLGVSRRRAQQILRPCITARVGANGLADRDVLIEHLQQIAAGNEGVQEMARRRKVAGVIDRLRQERLSRPQLLVEAPAAVVNQEFQSLPAGIRLECGRITVEFSKPHEALEKLLALAMAAGNDFEEFERRVSV